MCDGVLADIADALQVVAVQVATSLCLRSMATGGIAERASGGRHLSLS